MNAQSASQVSQEGPITKTIRRVHELVQQNAALLDEFEKQLRPIMAYSPETTNQQSSVMPTSDCPLEAVLVVIEIKLQEHRDHLSRLYQTNQL